MELGLSTEERAAVVAAVLAVGARASAVLGRLAPPDRAARCAAAARHLLALGRAERIDRLAAEAGALLADRPAGLGRVHPGWLEALVAGEPASVRAALAGGAAAPGPRGGQGGPAPGVRRWLRRAYLGRLVAMPEAPPPRGRPPRRDELPCFPPEELVAALEAAGRRRLALAARAAPPGAVAALAAALPSPHREAFLAEARAPAGDDEIRAAVRLIAGLLPDGRPVAGRRLLVLAGLRALAPALHAAGGDLPRQLAQRLPPALSPLPPPGAGQPPPAEGQDPTPDVSEILELLATNVQTVPGSASGDAGGGGPSRGSARPR